MFIAEVVKTSIAAEPCFNIYRTKIIISSKEKFAIYTNRCFDSEPAVAKYRTR